MADHARDDVGSHDDDGDDREAEDDLVPVRLRDGTEAVVVPLVPANREALQQEYAQLSADTRFDRFLSAVPELTDTMLDHLVDDVDGVDHVALVLLVTTEDGTELPLGLARIIRYPHDPTAADVAVTVVDAWHGRGLGGKLLRRLTARAKENRIRVFSAALFAENEAMLALFEQLGTVSVTRRDGPVLEIGVELPVELDTLEHTLREAAAGHVHQRR